MVARLVLVSFHIPESKEEDNVEVMKDVIGGMEERGYEIDSIIIHPVEKQEPLQMPDLTPMLEQIRNIMGKGPKEPWEGEEGEGPKKE